MFSLLLLAPALLLVRAPAARALPPLLIEQRPAAQAVATARLAVGNGGKLLAGGGLDSGRPTVPRTAAGPRHPAQATALTWLTFLALVGALLAVGTTPLWMGRRSVLRRHAVMRRGGMEGFPPSYYRCEDWREAECCRPRSRVG